MMHLWRASRGESSSSSSSTTTYLPLTTTSSTHRHKSSSPSSKNSNKCCGYSKFNCVILLVWIVFATWCIILYSRGFFNTTKEPEVFSETNSLEEALLRQNMQNDLIRQQHEQQLLQEEAQKISQQRQQQQPQSQQPTLPPSTPTGIIPIVVIAYQRATELKKCLDTIMRYMPQTGFRVFVSQDGNHPEVAKVARSYGTKVTLFQRERVIKLPKIPVGNNPSYYSLAQHYKFAINAVFKQDIEYSRIIILEEDLEIAPDFFSYFSRLSPLLDTDPTLLCISAWNDNGMRDYVSDTTQLYRSDFFPGLGWMMSRKLWEEELRDIWPLGYWDDWLREPGSRKGRNCIRPEINRTYTFGAKGTSSGQFFNNYLARIRLNSENIDWNGIDISYIADKQRYDENLGNVVRNAEAVNPHQLANYANQNKDLKIFYNDARHYELVAKQVGIMPELKAGVPRGAYLGIVSLKYHGNRLYLVPKTDRAEPMTYTNNPPFPPVPNPE